MAFVWQISALQFNNIVQISGVVLSGDLPDRRLKKSVFQNITSVIKSYFIKPYSNNKLTVRYGDNLFPALTDDFGGFSIEVRNDGVKNVDVLIPEKDIPLEIYQKYPVFIEETTSELSIITDIDDTILVSYIGSFYKRLKTLFLVTPHKRKSVDFTLRLLNAVSMKGGRAFYVSKSESNLFEILTTFIVNNNLPKGKLFLTPYLNIRNLVISRKGNDFKINNIKYIIENSPGKNFILLGDDTQRDTEVYKHILELFPGRIVKVFIRKTLVELKGLKKENMENLKNINVPVIYFSDEDDIAEELKIIEEYSLKKQVI